MTQLVWNDSLSIGVPLIDGQHKMLLEKLNAITQAVERNQGVPKIIKTLDFMIEYTDFHFTDEEGHMAETGYPGLAEQKEQHAEFKVTLNNLVQDFEEEGATTSLAEAINVFLFNWLVTHIKGLDVQFGKYLEEKGIELNG